MAQPLVMKYSLYCGKYDSGSTLPLQRDAALCAAVSILNPLIERVRDKEPAKLTGLLHVRAEASFKLGDAKLAADDYWELYQKLRSGSDLNSFGIVALRLSGALLRLGSLQETIDMITDTLRMGLDFSPKTLADLYNQRGNAHCVGEHLSDAEADFNKAVELFPNHFSAINNLGEVAALRGDAENAERFFLAAFEAARKLGIKIELNSLLNLASLYHLDGSPECVLHGLKIVFALEGLNPMPEITSIQEFKDRLQMPVVYA